MKATYFWLGLNIATALPASSAQAQAKPQAAALLTGRILHPTAPTVRLDYLTDWLTLEPTGHLTAQLSPTGEFRLSVPAEALGEARLVHGSESTALYLTRGDAVRLTLDTERFDESVRYTGRGAAANNYLAGRFLRFEDESRYESLPAMHAATSTPEQMRSYTDAYRQRQLAFLDSFARRQPLPPTFRAHARRAIDYGWANDLQWYPAVQKLNRQARNEAEAPPLPANFYSFRQQLRLPNDSALTNAQYRDYVSSFVNELDLTDSLQAGSQPFASVERRLGRSRSAEFAVAGLLYNKLEINSLAAVGELLPALGQYVRDSALVRTVRDRYRRLLPLQPGQPAPDFTLRDEAGQLVSLHDFRGQVVYLDFWASWCGPCIAEAPATARLRQQFAGRDVIFLAVSIDQQPDAWRKALDRFKLRGPNARHLIDPQHFEAGSLKAYEVRGVPTYWLIGREGQIIQGNAPRPSDEATVTAALENALKR